MQRPFVLLATDDAKFASMATDAILETRHGVRPAHDMNQAYLALSEGARNIGLAVIDVTGGQFGRQLLRALNGTHADFPILAITDPVDTPDFDHLDGLAIMRCEKNATASSLRKEIHDMCIDVPPQASPP